jgi:hypothetical protein
MQPLLGLTALPGGRGSFSCSRANTGGYLADSPTASEADGVGVDGECRVRAGVGVLQAASQTPATSNPGGPEATVGLTAVLPVASASASFQFVLAVIPRGTKLTPAVVTLALYPNHTTQATAPPLAHITCQCTCTHHTDVASAVTAWARPSCMRHTAAAASWAPQQLKQPCLTWQSTAAAHHASPPAPATVTQTPASTQTLPSQATQGST